MKIKIVIAILTSLLFFSCTKEGEFTRPMNNNPSADSSILVKVGLFSPTSGVTVSGQSELRIKNGESYIKLVDFSVSSGPDLKVYLSKSNTPSEFVNIGALVSSNTIYKIPSNVLIDEYPYVLIHCQQYNHLFAIAQLN